MKLIIEEDESQKWVLDTTEITDNEFREEKDNLIITVKKINRIE